MLVWGNDAATQQTIWAPLVPYIASFHLTSHLHEHTCSVPQFFESKMDTIVGHFLGKRSLFTRKVVLGVDGAWARD